MTPEEQATIKEHLRQVAEILYKNTPSAELTRFETIELSVREHLQETVAPEISNLSWCAFPCPEHGAGLVQIGALDKRLTAARVLTALLLVFSLLFIPLHRAIA